MHMAARGGDLDKVTDFVEKGGDVNIKHSRTGTHSTVSEVTCTTMIAISIIKHLVQK